MSRPTFNLALALVVGLGLAESALAAKPITPQTIEQAAKTITGQASLPVDGMKVLQSEGKLYFISGNGRYVFRGEVYDTWLQSHIDTIAQAQESSSRILLSKMGVKVDDLLSIRMGHGAKEVVFFTDPQCSYCHALANEANQYTSEYTFVFVPVPALGDESNRLIKRLACARDERQQLDALLNGTIEQLETLNKCPEEKYAKSLVTANLLGVDGIPYLISDDGRVSRGRPKNFEAWLSGKGDQ
ncbi:DsbC family protein [Pseudomonas luteola]|uniref:DsbC family protein n=1 Tax=Pseudomonas luteola TaxID=47886 RepID=UPI00123C6B3A|nr:DsbC family protein [Pseudomonas luteola]QEU26674.1 DsbC family protein [Pseudomonas luteola]